MAIVDHFNGADVDSVEVARGAAEERIANVSTVAKVVLLQSILQCPARNATCNFCRKTGHYERTCRRRKTGMRGRVGLTHEDGTDGGLIQDDAEESVSNYGGSVAWVTDSKAPAHEWDSVSSTDFVVMSVRRNKEEVLKVAGAKLDLRINGRVTQAWIDSVSPISVFTIRELKHWEHAMCDCSSWIQRMTSFETMGTIR